ncbi:MAG: hypothetical protein H6719_07000 [Sandaracinaceae bacterium]|nr:hypothetical protein [Sandaracinaceae bacterium]
MSAIRELRHRLPAEIGTWLRPFDEDLATAWRSCPRADWLVHIALQLGVGRTTVVHATAELVSAAVASRRVPDLRVNRALVITLKWLSGRALGSEAWAAGFSATDIADGLSDQRDAAAARAAGCLAFACDDDADPGFYAHRAYAAAAAAHATVALDAVDDAADRVRSFVPLHLVLDRVADWEPPSRRERIPTPIEPTPNPFYR